MAKTLVTDYDSAITDPFPGLARWPLDQYITLLQGIYDSIPLAERPSAFIAGAGGFRVRHEHMLTPLELETAKEVLATNTLADAIAQSKGLTRAEVQNLYNAMNAIV